MKLRNSILALALVGIASGAQAAPWVGDFNTGAASDGVLVNMSGFDIYADGSAAIYNVTTGQMVSPTDAGAVSVGDKLITYYQGVASAVTSGVTAPNLTYPGSLSGFIPGVNYEITVAAIIYETVMADTGIALVLNTTSAQVGLFFDNTPDFNIAAGTGFTNGTLIAVGNAFTFPLAPLTTVNYSLTETTGSTTLVGNLPFAQAGSTTPDVVGFLPTVPNGYNSTTTIQYGNQGLGYQTVNFFDNNVDAFGNPWTSVAVNKADTIRADANLNLTTVPEPATLALLGLGLIGLGFSQRRRAA